jgi:hypothetical protein
MSTCRGAIASDPNAHNCNSKLVAWHAHGMHTDQGTNKMKKQVDMSTKMFGIILAVHSQVT